MPVKLVMVGGCLNTRNLVQITEWPSQRIFHFSSETLVTLGGHNNEVSILTAVVVSSFYISRKSYQFQLSYFISMDYTCFRNSL